ncbi:TonB-dependent receptor [Azorhizobium oxalatiphilum]|uniref:TonB-dependent receptor n=1 Tax=Azorhizobium oxalatiphilum TaxID=980631 RepID=A0A917C962_9HYPH|nr:TonB-dependent receptor [Azorhizobium oxalatiphilum]GGF74695.1 TonB-dependent receptor [Azorhizobium oxalatiphilum]
MEMTTHAGRTANQSARLRIALLAGSMLALSTPPALAQSAAPARIVQQSVSIPAGPLTTALNRLAAQTGIEILFDATLTSGRMTAGVSGTLTPAQALDALLAGSGITARFAGSNQVVLSRPSGAAVGQGSNGDGEISLDAITVYGAKMSNVLQDTSASVGIVTSGEIVDGQIRDFRQAFRRLGNVMDGDWADNGFIIRGVNSEGLVPGGAPLASLYIDGVQQTTRGARRGARGLWDVEQVEVYRGPQSTLSGRAALAGAIYIKSKDPTFDKAAELSGTIGTGGLYGTAFMLNTPLVGNQVAMRLSGEFERSKNDINYPTFANYDRYDEFTTDTYYQLRGKILFQPDQFPDTRALLSYSFAHDDPYVRDIGGPGLGFRFPDRRGDYQAPAYIEYRPTDVHNIGFELTHDLSSTLRFTSMSAYSYANAERASPNYGTAGEINTYNGYYKDVLASQELRLNYTGDRFTWVAGLYGAYEDEKNHYDRTVSSFQNQIQYNTQKTTNFAGFGEATYEFLPSWKITAGGRVDYTKQDITQYLQRIRPLGALPVVMTNYATGFDEINVVPKFGLSKQLTEGQTVGVTYSQGFRTGGASYDTIEAVPYTYAPEYASTYELFYKGNLLDNRLTINANLFYTRYTDQQVQMQFDPADLLSRRILNAASSKAYGFEFEPSFKVTNNFTAFMSVGYVHTEFEEFDSIVYGDLAGMPFPEAPEWTVAFGGQYTFDNGIYVGADAKYTSSYLARLGTLPHDYLDSRWILNAQVGYKTGRWEFIAFAENLLNEEYFVYNDNDIAATLGEGRRVGLNVRAKF